MEEEETEQPRQAGPAPRPSDTQKRTNPKAPVRACGAQAPGALVAAGRRLLYPTHRRGHGGRRRSLHLGARSEGEAHRRPGQAQAFPDPPRRLLSALFLSSLFIPFLFFPEFCTLIICILYIYQG